ncbi:MAG: 4Fe-4S binding protein [Planctomycetes bacterium]|nr:4Fe-4S binding protein [Planctomycetota bacterium]
MLEQNSKNQKLLGLFPLNWRFDLASIPGVLWLLKKRWFPMIIILINMFLFMVILMSGVMGGFSSGNYSFGIMFVWILWWVLLMMLLVPVFSRSWCLMCPLPSFGEWLQRLRIFGVNNKLGGLNIKWPRRLRNMWLMNFLFLGTTFFSGFFTVKPLATFFLLGGIIVLGIILSLIFEKRSFCLYVCPVSGFQGLYSNMAMTEIRAKDPEVCAKHKKKTCETGNIKGYGCPWILQPHSFKRNTYCGMCLECFKTCPFDNMAFNLRPPGTDILVNEKRGLDEAWKSFIMLAIAVMFYVAMMGPWGQLKDWVRGNTFTGWLKFISLHTTFALVIIPGIFFVFAWLSKRFSGLKDISFKAVFVNLSYCLIPMGMAAWIAFSFGFLLPNGSYILHILSDPFARGWNLVGTANIPWTPVATGLLVPIQFITLFVGYIISADFGYKLSLQTYIEPAAAKRGFIPLLVLLTLVVIAFGWLYGG